MSTPKSEYRMPATVTQPPTVVRRSDEAFFSGYIVIVGRDIREFDAMEAYEFATSLLQLVKDFSPTQFEMLVSEDKRWRETLSSFSGTVKESDNSSPEVTG